MTSRFLQKLLKEILAFRTAKTSICMKAQISKIKTAFRIKIRNMKARIKTNEKSALKRSLNI